MRKRYTTIFSLAMVITLAMAQVVPANASSLSEIEQQKNQVNQQIQDTQQNKDKVQEKVDSLQDEADELNSTYTSLNNKLQSVSDEISDTEQSITTTSQEIEDLQTALADAKEAETQQYEGMKKRIQYTYENRNSSMITAILESGSIAEFVKNVEYTANMITYDREMMVAYEQLQEDIQIKTAELKDKSVQLSQYQDTLSAKQGELDDLVLDAGSAYAAKSGEVSVAQMSVDEYDALIESYRQQEKALEQQQAAAQAQIAQQIAEEEAKQEQETGQPVIEDNSGALSGYSQADLKLMASIIEAEAGNQSYAGKLAVGTVIMNRVKSTKFPNTLSGVIYQKNQFQPARDGHLDAILQRGPNASCIQAATEVLNGARSGEWLFFMTQYWADYYGITGYTMIGAHAFFTKWGAN